MKNTSIIRAGVVTTLLAFAQTQFAAQVNITIPDGTAGAVFTSAPTDSTGEDNETEPGTQQGQVWDLERVLLDGSFNLTILGGFNYASGQQGFHTGDIFIDTDGNIGSAAHGGNGYVNVSNSSLDYEYVVHFKNRAGAGGGYQPSDFAYDVYKLDASDTLVGVYFDILDSSNPFIFNPSAGDTAIASGTGSTGTYLNDAAANSAFGLSGDSAVTGYGGNDDHYSLTVSLAWFGGETVDPDEVDFTIGCGNDYIRGAFPTQGISTPDGGTTVMLLGMAFSGLAIMRRRSFRA